MSAPLAMNAVPMAVQSELLDGKLRVTMRIDAAALSFQELKGRWAGEFEIVLLYLDASGNGKGGAERSVPFDLSPAEREKAMTSGFNYQLDLPLIESVQRLAVGVKNTPSGRVGTLQIQLN